MGSGLYEDHIETGRVACVRRIEAGEGDALDNSLPVGERRSRV